jgi:hypothetical protein
VIILKNTPLQFNALPNTIINTFLTLLSYIVFMKTKFLFPILSVFVLVNSIAAESVAQPDTSASATQDKFNVAGVEILSPHYGAARDGNMTTIPADYLPLDYNQPHFKITYVKEDSPRIQ